MIMGFNNYMWGKDFPLFQSGKPFFQHPILAGPPRNAPISEGRDEGVIWQFIA